MTDYDFLLNHHFDDIDSGDPDFSSPLINHNGLDRSCYRLINEKGRIGLLDVLRVLGMNGSSRTCGDLKYINLLVLTGILLSTPLIISHCQAALSVTTVNTIQGSAPYIELSGIKAKDLSELLTIRVGSDTYISDASGNMNKVGESGGLTPITSITLATASAKFDSVSTWAPADTSTYSLNNVAVIPLSARKDDDGDNSFTITGNLKGEWKDKNNNVIGTTAGGISNLTLTPTICNAPYTLTLTMTDDPSINTQYGSPRSTSYDNNSAKFTINPVSVPTICYAKPDMSYANGQYQGPTNIWDQQNGFIPQSTNPGSYSNNFPTTGANGLYFDLDIVGVDSALIWPSVSQGNITATMSNITATSVRVTLTGPVASTTTMTATAPAPSVLPARFELRGNSGSTTVVSYGFELKKWYVNRRSQLGNAANMARWCGGLNGKNYALPKVKDLTNASGTADNNYYKRDIGKGLFSEWGSLSNYLSAGFVNNVYWTSNVSGSDQFRVNALAGQITRISPKYSSYGMCVTPP